MNESVNVEELLATYRQTLGECKATPVPAQPRRWKLRFAYGLALVGVVASALLLAPRDATAGAIHRINAALKDADSMTMIREAWTKNGWVLLSKTTYARGKWRYESSYTPALAVSTILRDGTSYRTYDRLDFTAAKPLSRTDFLPPDGFESAIDFAKWQLHFGMLNDGDKLAMQSRAAVDGRPVYAITLTGNRRRCEITVDASTDLPLTASIEMDRSDGTTESGRQTYSFNQPVDEALFKPNAYKPIVDVQKAEAALMEAWAKPLAEFETSKLRSATMCGDGAIWLVTSAPKSNDYVAWLPTEIPGYTVVSDQMLVSHEQARRVYQPTLQGEIITITVLVPIDGPQALEKATVTFALRNVHASIYAPHRKEPKEWLPPTEVPLVRVESECPDYLTALDLDSSRFSVAIGNLRARAEALELLGRDFEAATTYEQCAIAHQTWVKYAAYVPLERAAACYRRAGFEELAFDAEARARHLKESRER